jgi:hypothetical protein
MRIRWWAVPTVAWWDAVAMIAIAIAIGIAIEIEIDSDPDSGSDLDFAHLTNKKMSKPQAYMRICVYVPPWHYLHG